MLNDLNIPVTIVRTAPGWPGWCTYLLLAWYQIYSAKEQLRSGTEEQPRDSKTAWFKVWSKCGGPLKHTCTEPPWKAYLLPLPFSCHNHHKRSIFCDYNLAGIRRALFCYTHAVMQMEQWLDDIQTFFQPTTVCWTYLVGRKGRCALKWTIRRVAPARASSRKVTIVYIYEWIGNRVKTRRTYPPTIPCTSPCIPSNWIHPVIWVRGGH